MTYTITSAISGCKNGDRTSQKQLYHLISGEMFATSLALCENEEEAEEVLIKGFIHLFNTISTYSGEETFKEWCREIFISVARNYYKTSNKNTKTTLSIRADE